MKLKSYLEANSLSVSAFATKVQVDNRQTMWRYVHGKRMPPADLLLSISKATNGEVTAIDFAEQCAASARSRRTPPPAAQQVAS